MGMGKSKSARKVLEKLNSGPLTFGQMVRSIRETDEVTQDELASRLRVGKSFVSDVENGRRVPSAEKAVEWAKALGYPAHTFVRTVLQDQLNAASIKMTVDVRAA
jgi:transcriptional regulator with XRE-family HTH domain